MVHDLAPLPENCQKMEPLARSDFFGRTLILLISDAPNRFNMSISRSPAIFMKIGEGQIFTISRDLVCKAKNSYFQNMFRITQYGSRLFGIDASSDPTKFQGDWPSGSRLIGAWSSAFAFNVFVCQVEPLARSDFFGRTLILLISDAPNRFNMSISRSPAIFMKIGEGQIFTISRDLVSLYVRLKIAIFKTCSESLNMGRVCSVSMPVVTLQSFKVIGRLEVGELGRGPQLLRSMYLCVRWNHLPDRIFSAGH